MKIYVVGSSKNKFLPLDNIREKFLIDQPHEGDNIDFLNPFVIPLISSKPSQSNIKISQSSFSGSNLCIVKISDSLVFDKSI